MKKVTVIKREYKVDIIITGYFDGYAYWHEAR